MRSGCAHCPPVLKRILGHVEAHDDDPGTAQYARHLLILLRRSHKPIPATPARYQPTAIYWTVHIVSLWLWLGSPMTGATRKLRRSPRPRRRRTNQESCQRGARETAPKKIVLHRPAGQLRRIQARF